MRTVILNLTRFGDLLQSQAVVHALRKEGHAVGLVCLQNFAEAALLLDGLDAVCAVPGGGFLADLDAAWPKALTRLHDWHAVVRRFAPNDVLNLTPTSSARLLARLLAQDTASEPRGFILDDHGFGLSGTAWAAFFEASTRRRGCSPFNIVDVFLRASGLSGPAQYALRLPDAQALHEAQQRLSTLAAAVSPQSVPTGYIALQLGASDPKRQWPTHFFAAIGRKLYEHFGLMPVLLGAEHERALAEAYLHSGAPGINLAGATTLRQLAAVLRHMRLLITNDTGTMHLAAGLDIDCLAIFLATAQPWDTGPYREGCCSLEPALACHPCGFDTTCPHGNRCVQHITPEAVWPLVHSMCSGNGWVCPPETTAQARVWISQRDAAGYMDLASLSGHEYEDRTAWIRLQRYGYRQFLDSMDAKPDVAHTEHAEQVEQVEQVAQPYQSDQQSQEIFAAALSPEYRAKAVTILDQVDGLLHLFQEQGKLALMRPSERQGHLFLATCQRIGLVLDETDSFNALGRLWHCLSQEHGADLPGLLAFGRQFRSLVHNWNTLLKQQ